MKLPVAKKILIPSIIIIVGAGIAIYYLNMPAWLLVERTEREAEIQIPESVLSDFPKLKEALEKADERYNPRLPGTTTTKASSLEGFLILESLKTYGFDPLEGTSWVFIESEGKQYRFGVIFQYDPPLLA